MWGESSKEEEAQPTEKNILKGHQRKEGGGLGMNKVGHTKFKNINKCGVCLEKDGTHETTQKKQGPERTK